MSRRGNRRASRRVRRENRIKRYLSDTRAEIRNVAWPDREEATKLTLIVIAVTAGMSAFLGVLDFILSKVFGRIL